MGKKVHRSKGRGSASSLAFRAASQRQIAWSKMCAGSPEEWDENMTGAAIAGVQFELAIRGMTRNGKSRRKRANQIAEDAASRGQGRLRISNLTPEIESIQSPELILRQEADTRQAEQPRESASIAAAAAVMHEVVIQER